MVTLKKTSKLLNFVVDHLQWLWQLKNIIECKTTSVFPRQILEMTQILSKPINFNEKDLSDYHEIIQFITSNASLVYELNNHHQAATHLKINRKAFEKVNKSNSKVIFELLSTFCFKSSSLFQQTNKHNIIILEFYESYSW